MGFREWKNNSTDREIDTIGKNTDSLGDADVHTIRYWLYTPGTESWEEQCQNSIMMLNGIGPDDLLAYDSKEALDSHLKGLYGENSSNTNLIHMTWQFAREISIGDIVIAKKGTNEILGKGTVESDYEFKPELNGSSPHIRRVKWTNHGQWKVREKLPPKPLDEITNYSSLVANIMSLFETDGMDEEGKNTLRYPSYSMNDFLKEVYVDEAAYNTMVNIISSKKNIILQGAPGVGKTFVSKRIAYSIMGEKDVNRVMMIQFHQSYSYEDFIMGFRPSYNGFELKKGVFYNFCKKAEVDSEHEYFFIIDEINRGNLSKIFGELFMLIESDKRGSKYKLQLLYSDELFYVPENVYIIGLMNTADRSLAMLDYALRRRFAFFELKPGFKSDGFQKYRLGLNNRKFDALIQTVERLNDDIAADESLGEGFCIGHSFFCNMSPDELDDAKLSEIVDYELIPLLKEYWFDEPIKVKSWSDNLRSAIK